MTKKQMKTESNITAMELPTEQGTVISIGKCVYERGKDGWRQIGVGILFSHETVQMCADRLGFDVLWPKQVETELVGEQ